MDLENQGNLGYHPIGLGNTQLLNAKATQKGKLTARKRRPPQNSSQTYKLRDSTNSTKSWSININQRNSYSKTWSWNFREPSQTTTLPWSKKPQTDSSRPPEGGDQRYETWKKLRTYLSKETKPLSISYPYEDRTRRWKNKRKPLFEKENNQLCRFSRRKHIIERIISFLRRPQDFTQESSDS